ncbi:ATP-dependent RNA helicase RhlB-like [Oryza brachyantha]|uniref:ATP-dependent RNA helicase RhlB-like n=1 Tax=Oryza brachyantha TaxID=4533 RepID=UPI001ADA64CF|nr:ATP-dependent RNA helicase RhlB-like [Oryza brachyantha]
MREGRTNGGVDGEGEGGGGVVRRRRQPAAQPSTSGSAASSSSGRRAEEEGGGGGGSRKQGRRKNQRPREGVARAIRERLPAAGACWGNGAVVEGIGGSRGRSRRERPGDDRGGGEDDPGAATAAAAARAPAAAWCCVCHCPDEECRLEANPSANGKEDPGLRSLLEQNDFFSDDCNPHAASAAFPVPGDSSD